ncbi:MAG: PfkB family carbohydrate kinase [Solirubrobacteraceae bacterium]
MTRVAVVGHVEWVDFVPVERFPTPGEIIHAHGAFARAAGGGGVVAVVLAELGADVDFYCALGRDELGRAAAAQLADRGVRVHPAWREEPTRRAVTLLDPDHERTIITMGDRLEPLASDPLEWDGLRGADGVYMTAGDTGAMEHARQARVLVASPRARSALGRAGPVIDVLVYSGGDAGEREWAAWVEHRVRLHVATDGARGGSWWGESEGRWPPVAPPGAPRDAYGCGDSFAAGLTFGLASGASVQEAAQLGAQRGALCLTRAGAP